MRIITLYAFILTGMLIASQGSVAQPGGSLVEPNVDRPGMDYNDFDLSEARPELCQEACARTLINCLNTGSQKAHKRRGMCSESG